MTQYYCRKCRFAVSVTSDGRCLTCDEFVGNEENMIATEADIKPIKRPPEIKVNGARHTTETFVSEDPEVGPIKRHIRPRRQDCNHPILLEKVIIFPTEERNSAVFRGYSLPHGASVDFCVNCWSVNPENFDSEAHTLLANLLDAFTKRIEGPDPVKEKAAWQAAHDYMVRCKGSVG